MGQLQRNLVTVIGGRTVPFNKACPSSIVAAIFGLASTSASANSCYALLGGADGFLGPRTFDLIVSIASTPGLKPAKGVTNLAIELDEEQHFNRYRLATLSSRIYKSLPRFPLSFYQTYCLQQEPLCLLKASHSKYWSTPSSVRSFGPASTSGTVTGSGSPRWKQRSFYDYLRDILPLACTNFRVVRLSIYDSVISAGMCINLAFALSSLAYAKQFRSSIMKLINSRY
jgi:hypothetical protein